MRLLKKEQEMRETNRIKRQKLEFGLSSFKENFELFFSTTGQKYGLIFSRFLNLL